MERKREERDLIINSLIKYTTPVILVAFVCILSIIIARHLDTVNSVREENRILKQENRVLKKELARHKGEVMGFADLKGIHHDVRMVSILQYKDYKDGEPIITRVYFELHRFHPYKVVYVAKEDVSHRVYCSTEVEEMKGEARERGEYYLRLNTEKDISEMGNWGWLETVMIKGRKKVSFHSYFPGIG